MKYAQSILDLIGNTPLIKLNHVTGDTKATVLVKLEYLNPGGSIKDRIAAQMIEDAERDGKLQPGGHHRGTHVRQHRGGTGAGSPAKGLQVRFCSPGQGGRGQARRAARLRGRGGGHAHRRAARQPAKLLRRLGPDRARDPRRLQAGPVLQPRGPGEPLPNHRARNLERYGRHASPTASSAPAPAVPSRAPAGTSRKSRRTGQRPTAAGSGSSARTRKVRSTRAVPDGRTSSKAWGRTCGPGTTTSPSRTR